MNIDHTIYRTFGNSKPNALSGLNIHPETIQRWLEPTLFRRIEDAPTTSSTLGRRSREIFDTVSGNMPVHSLEEFLRSKLWQLIGNTFLVQIRRSYPLTRSP